MIKKVLHIIFASIILATTVGMTISEHYCGDTLINISILDVDDACCDDPDCCHNESETYIVEDSYSISSFNYEFTILATIFPSVYEQFKDSLNDKYNVLSWIDAPPPPKIQTFLSQSQSFLL
jgi:hypothetical protein